MLKNRRSEQMTKITRLTFLAALSFILFSTTSAWAQSLSGPQKNAVRSAKSYLAFQAFSRDGLIDQLSSEYGDGYSVTDATKAVDSLSVNWNAQAVKSAKQYLDMMGFSCSGLVEQLSSSAGDQYTRTQAMYGAQQAGAC